MLRCGQERPWSSFANGDLLANAVPIIGSSNDGPLKKRTGGPAARRPPRNRPASYERVIREPWSSGAAAAACREASGRSRRPCAGSTRRPPDAGGSGTALRADPRRQPPLRAPRSMAVAATNVRAGPSASSSMRVRTPLRAQARDLQPLVAIVIASHSAKATAACFVTAYGAEPICVRSPAADAVCSR